ncbi:hypothetical protein AGMMS4956_18730 [Bacteroidia bacterium]|nr:hypothetical protein AGMMS4956_18730 [Bacteroidia bacterium]
MLRGEEMISLPKEEDEYKEKYHEIIEKYAVLQEKYTLLLEDMQKRATNTEVAVAMS